MATTYANLMQLGDQGRQFTAIARETVSGGFVLCASGTTDLVNVSGAVSFVAGDLLVVTGKTMNDARSGARSVVGLAVTSAASGESVTFVSDGYFILESLGAIVAGAPIYYAGSLNYFSQADIVGSGFLRIGTALTAASADDKFFVARLKF